MDRGGGGVVLRCESGGWYPQPELLWLDAEGKLLPAGPPETARGPGDLYTVSSTVTVEKRRSNNFTCRVQQNTTLQTRDAHLTVPEEFFGVPGGSAARVSVSLLVLFTCVPAVAFLLWRWRRNTMETRKASQAETQQLMAESQKREMAETLRRKEEEHGAMAGSLREQTEAMKRQRDELQVQQEKTKNLVKDTDKKFESVDKELKEKGEDGVGCAKLREVISLYKWGLNDREKELHQLVVDTEKLLEKTEKLLEKTEKVLEKTEEVITATADRKEEAQDEE